MGNFFDQFGLGSLGGDKNRTIHQREGMLEILSGLSRDFPGKQEAIRAVKDGRQPGPILNQGLIELIEHFQRQAADLQEQLRLAHLDVDIKVDKRIREQIQSLEYELRKALREFDVQVTQAETAQKELSKLKQALESQEKLHQQEVEYLKSEVAKHQQVIVRQQDRIDALLNQDDCA